MGQAVRKVTAKDTNEKLAHRRLTVLELAERLGNVAEACRRGGIDRASFYDWKRRFQLHGLDGLKDLPPIAKSHPMATPPEVVARIEQLALTHPAYGCNRLEALLALEGRRVSAITIQKILNDKGLGSRQERWLALERQNADQVVELSAEQAAFLEKLNPCFRERHVESGRPGELLSADTFMVGTLKGIGRVYLHTVVDTFGSYAFGFLHVSKQPEAAVAVLHNEVLPSYRELDLPIGAVLTDNGREFCGTERHPYELYLALNEIEHRRTRVGTPRTNGFVERFHGTMLEEFFRPVIIKGCSRAWAPCRPTSTPGWSTTTASGRTWATATRAEGRGKPSSSLSVKQVKRTHELFQAGALVLSEEHDIVYRDPSRSRPARADGVGLVAQFQKPFAPDSTMLFRYSALTFNGHRIHYDVDYCREVEGYDDLVVHGPLCATLLAGFAEEASGKELRRFSYRGLRPALLGAALTLNAAVQEGHVAVWTTLPDGGVSMRAEAEVG